jgi:hypothetical protein
MSKLVLSCLNNVLSNRQSLCKYFPNEVFGRTTSEVVSSIVHEIQTQNELSKSSTEDLFILNTYLNSKLGKYCQSKEYILN